MKTGWKPLKLLWQNCVNIFSNGAGIKDCWKDIHSEQNFKYSKTVEYFLHAASVTV